MIKSVSLLITAIFTLSCSLSFADMNFTGSEDSSAMPKSNGDHAEKIAANVNRLNTLDELAQSNFAGPVVGAASGAASNDEEEGVAVGSWDLLMDGVVSDIVPMMEPLGDEGVPGADIPFEPHFVDPDASLNSHAYYVAPPMETLGGESAYDGLSLEQLKSELAVINAEIELKDAKVKVNWTNISAQKVIVDDLIKKESVAFDISEGLFRRFEGIVKGINSTPYEKSFALNDWKNSVTRHSTAKTGREAAEFQAEAFRMQQDMTLAERAALIARRSEINREIAARTQVQ